MIALFLMLLVPGQATPDRPVLAPTRVEPFDGKFGVTYWSMRYIRAPCGPGAYRISLPDRPGVSVAAIEYDPATPAAARGSPGQGGPLADGLAIDGRVTFVRAGGRTVAVILARRAVPGLWKP